MKQKNELPLGIFSWFGWVMPLPQRLEMIKNAGFNSTMVWWEDEIGCPGIIKERMPEIVRNSGLLLENIHVPYDNIDDLWSESQTRRESMVKRHIEWLHDCARYQIPLMVMHITDHSCPSKPNEYGIESLKQIVKTAEDLGVRIAIENTGSVEYIDFVLNEIDSKTLGFCYDSSHDWLYSRDKVAILKKQGHRLYCTHFSDNDGVLDRHWVPGDGSIQWEIIRNSFPAASYKGHISLEVFRGESDLEMEPQHFLSRAYQRALWLAAWGRF